MEYMKIEQARMISSINNKIEIVEIFRINFSSF